MKKVFVIVLFSFFILIMNMQSGLQLLVYEVAKPIITKKFCVNIDQPELKCNGKCHLKKILIEEEEQVNNSNPVNIPAPKLKIEQVCFFVYTLKNESSIHLKGQNLDLNNEISILSREEKQDIFRPPIV